MSRECCHNSGVNCFEQFRCQVCGWNPEVTECRKTKIRGTEPAEPVKKKGRSGGRKKA